MNIDIGECWCEHSAWVVMGGDGATDTDDTATESHNNNNNHLILAHNDFLINAH